MEDKKSENKNTQHGGGASASPHNESPEMFKGIRLSLFSESVEMFVSDDDLDTEVVKKVASSLVESGFLKPDYNKFDILYELFGLNIHKDYEALHCEHKSLFGAKVKCTRYSGYERNDLAWFESDRISQTMRKRFESILARKNHERW